MLIWAFYPRTGHGHLHRIQLLSHDDISDGGNSDGCGILKTVLFIGLGLFTLILKWWVVLCFGCVHRTKLVDDVINSEDDDDDDELDEAVEYDEDDEAGVSEQGKCMIR